MYALCVSGAVNTLGCVWKFFLCAIYKFSFIHSFRQTDRKTQREVEERRGALAERDTEERGLLGGGGERQTETERQTKTERKRLAEIM